MQLYLKSGGSSIVDKIEELHSARDKFSTLSAALNFEWISAITDPLETLRLCLGEIETLKNCHGPVELLSPLAKSSAPAESLNALIKATKTVSDTAEKWEDALDALWDGTEIKALDICSKTLTGKKPLICSQLWLTIVLGPASLQISLNIKAIWSNWE